MKNAISLAPLGDLARSSNDIVVSALRLGSRLSVSPLSAGQPLSQGGCSHCQGQPA